MISATKFLIDESTVEKLFENAGFKDVTSIRPLTAGEFNSAYVAGSGGREYVLKLAPRADASVLTYERGMMAREVDFYRRIREETSVKVPEIFCYDPSLKLVNAEYFIMEKLNGAPLAESKFKKEERDEIYFKLGVMISKLHDIRGEGFGYVQNGLKDNWYDAVRTMTLNIIGDCEGLGKKIRRGYKLLEFIDLYKDILSAVEPTYTHFDVWEGNVFCERTASGVELTLIDTERGFYGDRLGDFCSVYFLNDLNKKKALTDGYNSSAARPLKFDREELIRFNILLGYLALISHTEKYVRYKKTQFRYYISVIMSALFCRLSFKRLARLKRDTAN